MLINNGYLYSIVVPVYNSKNSLAVLIKTISEVMKSNQLKYELILVDDGSSDNSFEEIVRLSKLFPSINGFKLSRNFGHQAAVLTGLQKSNGDIIAIIDDDLQDPPHILLQFFEQLTNGADVAYGVRRNRKENIIKRTLFSTFYFVLKQLSNINIPRDSGDFCAMKRRVVDSILKLQDGNPFLRGMRAWVGFNQIGIEYDREKRYYGKSGYSLKNYFRLATTGILTFSYVPLRIATYTGLLASILGILYAIAIVLYWFFVDSFDVPGYLSLIVIISFLGGIQLICIGIIGEYISRLNDNTRKWPIAIISDETGD